MILHMLRWEMGDENFFTALNNYLYDPALVNAFALTEDLVAHCEAVADTSFTEFFNDWLYGEGYPTYNLKYRRGEANSLLIQLSQQTSDPSVDFFEMHVPIRAYGHTDPESRFTIHESRITNHESRVTSHSSPTSYSTILPTTRSSALIRVLSSIPSSLTLTGGSALRMPR